MKLLGCTSEYPPDYSAGIGNVAYNVVEQLRKKGIDCTVCSPNGDIKLGSSKMIDKFGILGLLYYWWQVYKYFKENDFDVVWLHNPLFFKSNIFGDSLVTMHVTAYGQVIHKIYPLHLHIYKKTVSKIERYCLNKIKEKTRFTGVSTQVCKELEGIGIAKQRITYISNGVDTKLFKPSDNKKSLRKKFGIPEEDVIILSLGRLTKAKQPQKLIEVFSRIEKEIKDVILVIAGKGELLDKTKKFVRQKKMKNVIFLGYVDHEKEAPNLYACSDYYIMTSKYEGQPLTLLEAMASGLPCIVSDIPNLKIVEDAECGIIVDFCDEEQAARKIVGYLEGVNSEHSKNAREYAVKNLDWKIIAGRYLEEFNKIKA